MLTRARFRFIVLVAVAAASLVIAGGTVAPATSAEASSVTPSSAVLASQSDFDRIAASSDDRSARLKRALLKRADSIEAQPVVTRKLEGGRLLATSRETLDRAMTLGMAYRLSGTTRYSDRLWRELDAVTRFTDWNPDHFLDTAEMATAVAIGRDWIKDRLSGAQKSQVAEALRRLAVQPALRVYDAPASSPGPYKYG